MSLSNSKRDEIQAKARGIWRNTGKRGLLAMATGTGKSKIAVDEIKSKFSSNPNFKCLLVVPTEVLRDINWKQEFEKWDAAECWEKIDRECYASIAKIKGNTYDLVVLDEAHYITLANGEFFKDNSVRDVLALTATPPEDPLKQLLLDNIAPIVYIYTLNEAVKDGLIAPFNITVVEQPLNKVDKNIVSGSKARPFFQTEQAKYEYLTKRISDLQEAGTNMTALKFAYLSRMRFIYNLPSKLKLAKRMMEDHMQGRYLVFGGSISQIDSLCSPNVFHSKSSIEHYNKFTNEEIDHLGVVKSVNEGHNIPNLDAALIVQLNSKELDVIQRIGRTVRWRPGHTSTIYILVASGTQDEIWADRALQGFDNITYIKPEQL